MPVPAPTEPPKPTRRLAEQAFSRATDAALSRGNDVQLMIDAQCQFDAWRDAIGQARQHILLENYLIANDTSGRAMRDALVERARAGVSVHVVRDWFGCFGQSSRQLLAPLLEVGGEVHVYNPPHLDSPFGWVSRDHRKMLVVDHQVGFVSGVCIADKWLGDAARQIEPWRDTGVQLRGPALAGLYAAFAGIWADTGTPLPDALTRPAQDIAVAGEVELRIVATRPQTAGLYRLDQLIAGIAGKSLWLTDAYFIGTAAYVQALGAAARDGVDVRLLVPGSSNIPLVAAMSRSGYRALLEAGIRVFEWQGSMLHAKTAVADGRWARIGSSNLNIASWMGNYELDVAIEDSAFGKRMQAQYEHDLENAQEVVLPRRTPRDRNDAASHRAQPHYHGRRGRSAASALRLARTVGAALANRRTLGVAEAGVLLGGGAVLALVGSIGIAFPRVLAWPLAIIMLWLAVSLGLRYIRLRHRTRGEPDAAPRGDDADDDLIGVGKG